MKRPIIGIVMNYDEGGKYFSNYPWYGIRCNYFEAIDAAGGTPLAIPYYKEHIQDYVNCIDGLLISGGEDYPPEFYGDTPLENRNINLIPGGRAEFDMAIIPEILKKNKPLLGICAGQQAINIHFNGTLIQDIHTSFPDALAHMHEPDHETGHPIHIVENTLLHRITGKTSYAVNSRHHQAVNVVGQGLIVNAKAPDGIIEGIEHPDYKFCLGVEWHPEYQLSMADKKILSAFVAAAQI